eukprot:TRINITY_DN7211_c0_g1_i6.p1 TRINITY_DN7211_c0_g1~~TRINITY_DN7211_c0_g1_i6.p1  ORF type:complete len:904 (-),score=158.66 TRINITY_DN7211_c0_g1_i6:222-2933(-)
MTEYFPVLCLVASSQNAQRVRDAAVYVTNESIEAHHIAEDEATNNVIVYFKSAESRNRLFQYNSENCIARNLYALESVIRILPIARRGMDVQDIVEHVKMRLPSLQNFSMTYTDDCVAFYCSICCLDSFKRLSTEMALYEKIPILVEGIHDPSQVPKRALVPKENPLLKSHTSDTPSLERIDLQQEKLNYDVILSYFSDHHEENIETIRSELLGRGIQVISIHSLPQYCIVCFNTTTDLPRLELLERCNIQIRSCQYYANHFPVIHVRTLNIFKNDKEAIAKLSANFPKTFKDVFINDKHLYVVLTSAMSIKPFVEEGYITEKNQKLLFFIAQMEVTHKPQALCSMLEKIQFLRSIGAMSLTVTEEKDTLCVYFADFRTYHDATGLISTDSAKRKPASSGFLGSMRQHSQSALSVQTPSYDGDQQEPGVVDVDRENQRRIFRTACIDLVPKKKTQYIATGDTLSPKGNRKSSFKAALAGASSGQDATSPSVAKKQSPVDPVYKSSPGRFPACDEAFYDAVLPVVRDLFSFNPIDDVCAGTWDPKLWLALLRKSQEDLRKLTEAKDMGGCSRMHQRINSLRIIVSAHNLHIFRSGLYAAPDPTTLPPPGDTLFYTSIPQVNRLINGRPTIVQVWNQDCLVVAESLVQQGFKVAVMNLASAKSPGGGYKSGLGALEENLFRRTNYAMSLDTAWNEPDRKSPNYPLSEEGGAFTPNVSVFRKPEEDGYSLMSKPFQCNMVAVAGVKDPVLEGGHLSMKDALLTRKRIELALRVCLNHECDAVVLGALGCGVYHNPPSDIADCFNSALCLYAPYFRKIIFAIVDSPTNPTNNYVTFRDFYTSVAYAPTSHALMSINMPLCGNPHNCTRGDPLHVTSERHLPLCPDPNCQKSCQAPHAFLFQHGVRYR